MKKKVACGVWQIFAVVAWLAAPAVGIAEDEGSTDLVAAAIANPQRPAEQRERDARSKPEVVLPLLQLGRGDTVADILGGGGYYSELLAGIVGEEGTVILHNNTPYSTFVSDLLQERYGQGKRPPVQLLKSEVDNLQLEAGSLDAALMVMSYHDLYYTNPERGWGNTDVPLFLTQLGAALKPGARLVIVDHVAAAGTGSSAPQTLHRIEPDYVRDELTGHGFRFVTSSSALRNPSDDHTKLVFDKSIRGKTDRFILVFEKI